MGKIGRNPRRNKRKYNLLGKEISDSEKTPSASLIGWKEVSESPALKSDLFSKLSIDINKLAQTLSFPLESKDDVMSVISSKKGLRSSEPYQQTKKARRQKRRSAFIQHVVEAQKLKEEQKKAARRQQIPVVGDMQLLGDTLPVISDTLTASSSKIKGKQANEDAAKPVKTFKQRQKQLMSDVNIFNKVLEHPMFQKDAANTILEHLQNKYL